MNIARMATVAGLTLTLGLVGYSFADDDDDHDRRYKRPKRLAVPSDAPLVWKEECAACHMLYVPGLLPAAAWRQQMSTLDEHYGSNATLEPELEQQILDFLVRASAANRLPAAASYLREWGADQFVAFKLDVVRIVDGGAAEVTTFGPSLFPAFGLPPVLE